MKRKQQVCDTCEHWSKRYSPSHYCILLAFEATEELKSGCIVLTGMDVPKACERILEHVVLSQNQQHETE